MLHIVVETTLSRRIDRVVNDVCSLLHDDSAEAKARAMRWVAHVLQDANSRGPWWFLKKRVAATLTAGQDIVELRGDIDKVSKVFAPGRLRKLTLEHLTELRADAVANNKPNAGTPFGYAIEYGSRLKLHLWPAPPAGNTALQVLFTRPIDVAVVPDAWETIILNGVIGLFGRHFDRDQLAQDPVEFEKRYERQLRRAISDSHDVEISRGWDDTPAGTSTVAPLNSTTDAATAVTVPASLSGIGYVTIETGEYPLTVA